MSDRSCGIKAKARVLSSPGTVRYRPEGLGLKRMDKWQKLVRGAKKLHIARPQALETLRKKSSVFFLPSWYAEAMPSYPMLRVLSHCSRP